MPITKDDDSKLIAELRELSEKEGIEIVKVIAVVVSFFILWWTAVMLIFGGGWVF